MNDNTILNIKYYKPHNEGEIKIDLKNFFPTTVSNYRKLLRTISLDSNNDQLFHQLKDFIFKEIASLRIKKDAEKTKLLHLELVIHTCADMISTRKGKHGEPLSVSEINILKRDVKQYTKQRKEKLKKIQETEKTKTTFRKYLTLLEKHTGGFNDF